MTKTAKTLLSLLLVLLAVLMCFSCSKNSGSDDTDKSNNIYAEGIIGEWVLSEDEWISRDKPETWEFTSDGSFIHRQTDKEGNAAGEVKGSYTFDGGMLILTVDGYVQPPCKVSFADGNTLSVQTQEKTVELKRK